MIGYCVDFYLPKDSVTFQDTSYHINDQLGKLTGNWVKVDGKYKLISLSHWLPKGCLPDCILLPQNILFTQYKYIS